MTDSAGWLGEGTVPSISPGRVLPLARRVPGRPEPAVLGRVRVRSCGACSACCTVMGVDGVEKPPHQACIHQRRGGGCGIYDERPEECRAYACLWLLGETGAERDRPDRLGLIFDALPGSVDAPVWKGEAGETPIPNLAAREVRPGAHLSKRGAEVLQVLAADAVVVIHPWGMDASKTIGPAGLVREMDRRARRLARRSKEAT